MSTALADPKVVARAAAGADQDARRLLDEALATAGPITVMGVGYGRFAGYPDAEPASWLLERGLLLPVTYSQLDCARDQYVTFAVKNVRGRVDVESAIDQYTQRLS